MTETLEAGAVEAADIGNVEVGGNVDQYLTFMLDGEEYGVDILRVQEIKGWDNVTPIPRTPDYMLGVINLRGTVVPIIDLRIRFDMEQAPYSSTTVVIVLRIMHRGQERVMGIVVDAVSDVYNVSRDDVKPSPGLGNHRVDFVRGLATVQKKMVILLDVDALLSADEADVLEHADQNSSES